MEVVLKQVLLEKNHKANELEKMASFLAKWRNSSTYKKTPGNTARGRLHDRSPHLLV